MIKEFGYSIEIKNSTIPNSGLGLFVNGKIKKGTIIAIYPGVIWTLEQMTSSLKNEDFVHYLENNSYICLRYDKIRVDANFNNSNCSSLFEDTLKELKLPENELYLQNNPWAKAHYINHPSIAHKPNALFYDFNFADYKRGKIIKINTKNNNE